MQSPSPVSPRLLPWADGYSHVERLTDTHAGVAAPWPPNMMSDRGYTPQRPFMAPSANGFPAPTSYRVSGVLARRMVCLVPCGTASLHGTVPVVGATRPARKDEWKPGTTLKGSL